MLEIITFIGVLLTFALGIWNIYENKKQFRLNKEALKINEANRRNNQLDRIHKQEFDFWGSLHTIKISKSQKTSSTISLMKRFL